MARTNYLWDEVNDTLLAETDENGNTIAEYTHEPGQFGPLISQRRNGHTYYHHYDGLGSTRALTDESGNVTDRYTYDAWGNEVAQTGTTANPFRWVGRMGYYFDIDVGTFYIRARTYDPVVGRWVSQDPLFYPPYARLFSALMGYGQDQWNLMQYASSNPLSRTDPAGMEPSSDAATDEWPFPACEELCHGLCFKLDAAKVESCEIEYSAGKGCAFWVKPLLAGLRIKYPVCDLIKNLAFPQKTFSSCRPTKEGAKQHVKCKCEDKKPFKGKDWNLKIDRDILGEELIPSPIPDEVKDFLSSFTYEVAGKTIGVSYETIIAQLQSCHLHIKGSLKLTGTSGWIGKCVRQTK